MDLKKIKCWFIDVDGTMTDSGIYYDESGNEIKKFSTKDAAGFFIAHKVGMQIIVLTGRECKAVKRRLKELKADLFVQNIKDKRKYLEAYILQNEISLESVGYIGDDLNDYSAMSICGFKACPIDGCKEIKELCDYVSPIEGGHGAVRDIIEYVLRQRGEWDFMVREIYSCEKAI